ncbi:dsDNA nuclease domain-containing protein, partial [Imhoffiella purpurea]|uniref:dsDNA nuclease domain-containing protein n=1 Tax=Imhoffiella purpurea TaxID=1249627 RepID=UPI0012FD7BE1
MANAPMPNPENTLADGDPGDDTANRYRFQWTWAAIMCCKLLDDSEDVEEVFCEHHEDVLLGGDHNSGPHSCRQRCQIGLSSGWRSLSSWP